METKTLKQAKKIIGGGGNYGEGQDLAFQGVDGNWYYVDLSNGISEYEEAAIVGAYNWYYARAVPGSLDKVYFDISPSGRMTLMWGQGTNTIETQSQLLDYIQVLRNQYYLEPTVNLNEYDPSQAPIFDQGYDPYDYDDYMDQYDGLFDNFDDTGYAGADDWGNYEDNIDPEYIASIESPEGPGGGGGGDDDDTRFTSPRNITYP